MCSKHVEAWNKTYCEINFCIKLVKYRDKFLLRVIITTAPWSTDNSKLISRRFFKCISYASSTGKETHFFWFNSELHRLYRNSNIQGDSVARGPKQLPLKSTCKYSTSLSVNWRMMNSLLGITNKTVKHITLQTLACEKLKVFSRQNYLKKIWPPRSPDLTSADFFLWGLLKGTVYKNTPRTIEQLKDAYAKRFKPSTSTFWEKYSRIWRKAFKCAWMWKETSFSIDYEQILFCIVPGMCI